ncbi:MAG: TolC family protein [Verrucomicrobiota bacterium]
MSFCADAPSTTGTPPGNQLMVIDLPTTLRLAGAKNLDVQLARERLNEAKANHSSAQTKFFPWVSPGIAYRRHDHLSQDTAGNVYNVHRDSYAPGATINAQLDLGEAIYQSLAAKQMVKAYDHALEASRQNSVMAAAHGYLELVYAQSATDVAQESVRIATEYTRQLENAAAAGIAFKGDVFRARVQQEHNQLAVKRAAEQHRVAGLRLAQMLRLDPTVMLTAADASLAPMQLVDTNTTIESVVMETLRTRPELKQNQALIAAARNNRESVKYGPLIPSIGVSGFLGGLGGSAESGPSRFGNQEDLYVNLGWRLGPGGLFDSSRIRASTARLKTAELTQEKICDELTRQAIEALVHYQSLRGQLDSASRALAAAEESLSFARQRKEFAVGVVLETIQSEQDLTRTRLEYLKIIAEFNKAQYLLQQTMGKL